MKFPHHTLSFLFISGLFAGVTQVLILRELLRACFGNEMTLGLTLAAWLVWGAMGAVLGGRRQTADPDATIQRALLISTCSLLAVIVSLLLIRAYPILAAEIPMRLADLAQSNDKLVRLFEVILATQPGEMLGPLHVVLLSFLATLPTATCCGALFATGLHLRARITHDGATGQAYAVDALGHLVGGLLLGGAAVSAINIFWVTWGAFVLLGLTCLVLITKASIPRKQIWTATLVLLILAGAIINPSLHRISDKWRWNGREILAQVSSVYGHVAVAKQGDEGVVFFENGTPTGTSPAVPAVQEFITFIMLQHPAPKEVLIIGGGAMGGLQEILKHNPQSVDYLELDPAILQLAKTWVSDADKKALNDPRVKTHNIDGRHWVLQPANKQKYDVVLCMLPDPSTALLNRFYTSEWFNAAQSVLGEGGVFGWTMSSSRGYLSPGLQNMNMSLLAASENFKLRAIMTGDATMAVACADPPAKLSDDAVEISKRLQTRKINALEFEAVMTDRLDLYNKQYVLDALGASQNHLLNNDMEPGAYFAHQAMWLGMYWSQIETSLMQTNWQDLMTKSYWWLTGLAMLLLVPFGFTRGARRAWPVATVFATGVIAMTLELCILFVFQASYGYVYRLVGVIIGAFMLGMALGAWQKKTPDMKTAMRQLAILLCILWGSFHIIMLVIGHMQMIAGSLWVIGECVLLTAVIGFIAGRQFVLAAASLHIRGVSASQTASKLYAADLIGAALGAVLTGTFLLPVVGVMGTIFFIQALIIPLTVFAIIRSFLDR